MPFVSSDPDPGSDPDSDSGVLVQLSAGTACPRNNIDVMKQVHPFQEADPSQQTIYTFFLVRCSTPRKRRHDARQATVQRPCGVTCRYRVSKDPDIVSAVIIGSSYGPLFCSPFFQRGGVLGEEGVRVEYVRAGWHGGQRGCGWFGLVGEDTWGAVSVGGLAPGYGGVQHVQDMQCTWWFERVVSDL